MDDGIPYWVSRPTARDRAVEAWSGYPLQFAGQRRFPWQDRMAAELRTALAELAIEPGEPLAGMHQSTDDTRCDAENRLFTNASDAIPRQVTAIRFERGLGQPPEPPLPIERVAGHLYYYKYSSGAAWESWEPAQLLARWRRVPRHLADDGSARPVWLAMKSAAIAGEIDTYGAIPDDHSPFGLRIVVHAGPSGPRFAPAISETLIDGTVAAFHAGDTAPAVAAALANRIQSVPRADIESLVATDGPGPLFAASPFVVRDHYVQISPSDERCYAGEVAIRPDARDRFPEISGELFTLRRVALQTSLTT
jgi:hypothetical protein